MIPHQSNDTSHIDTINERSSPNRRRRRRQIRGTAVERRCRVHLRSRPRPRRANARHSIRDHWPAAVRRLPPGPCPD